MRSIDISMPCHILLVNRIELGQPRDHSINTTLIIFLPDAHFDAEFKNTKWLRIKAFAHISRVNFEWC